MRTTCPSCDTAYTIPDDRIGAKGRKVRCTRCGEQWRVTTADIEPVEVFAAEEADPVDEAFARAPAPDVAPTEDEPPAPRAAREIDPFDALPPEPEATGLDEAKTDPFDRAPAAEPDPVAALPAEAAEPVDRPKPAPRKRAERRRPHLKMPRLPAALVRIGPFVGPAVFLGACLVLAGLAMFRTTVVTHAPGLAGFYRLVGLEVNLRGLDFGPIETLREMDNGQPVLVVEGSLANSSGAARDVPALRFALRDADAQELYAWSVDPRATVIAAGDRLRFRTRLVAPPDRAADLQVRFAERRNRQAGLP